MRRGTDSGGGADRWDSGLGAACAHGTVRHHGGDLLVGRAAGKIGEELPPLNSERLRAGEGI